MPRNKNLMTGVTLVPFSEKPEEGKIALTGKTLQQYRETKKAIEVAKEAQAKLATMVKDALVQKNMLEAEDSPILSWNFDRFQIGYRDDEKGKSQIATKKRGRASTATSAAVARVPKGLSL